MSVGIRKAAMLVHVCQMHIRNINLDGETEQETSIPDPDIEVSNLSLNNGSEC